MKSKHDACGTKVHLLYPKVLLMPKIEKKLPSAGGHAAAVPADP